MKRISQRDIARQLGVNVSTVSRALRGLEGVSPQLKEQIEKAGNTRLLRTQVLTEKTMQFIIDQMKA